jgi:hypothetical protein
VNKIRELLGKERYEISLKWDTVEQTLNKIKEFADQVERHNSRSGQWNLSTYKEDTGDMERAFRPVTIALENAAEYDLLKRDVMLKGGKATVTLDWQSRKIKVE